MNHRRVWAIARAEWIHNLRDVRSLLVIAALPVVLLLLYGYGINFDLDHIPFAVYDLDGGEQARQVIEQFRSNRYFDLQEVFTDRHRAEQLLNRAAVVFVLVIPPDLGRTLGAGRPATVQVLLDGADVTRANVALGYVQAALQDLSTKVTADYLQRESLPSAHVFTVLPTILYNPGLKSVFFIVPGLIALILTLLAALLTSTAIVREREWGSFEVLVTSPAQAREILVGKMIPYIGMAFADVMVCILVGWLVFGVAPVGSRALLLAVSALYLMASLSIGLLFSVIARTQQLAILLAMLLTLLPTTLLSGFVFPLHSIPAPIRIISNIIPATHFLVIIRALYLKGAGLAVLWPRVLVLLALVLVVITVAARRFKKQL
jgi:ABC-2 type transport system permease protein